jgi:hypothetical protein
MTLAARAPIGVFSAQTSPCRAPMGDVIVIGNTGNLFCAQPCLAEQFLGMAHGAANAHGDLPNAVSLAVLHPEHEPLGFRQRGQDLVRGDARDVVGRLRRALGWLFVDHPSLSPPIVDARVSDRGVKPRLRVPDVGAFPGHEAAHEDVVHERLRLVRRNAEFLLGMESQPPGQQLVQLLKRPLAPLPHCSMSRTRPPCSSIRGNMLPV